MNIFMRKPCTVTLINYTQIYQTYCDVIYYYAKANSTETDAFVDTDVF